MDHGRCCRRGHSQRPARAIRGGQSAPAAVIVLAILAIATFLSLDDRRRADEQSRIGACRRSSVRGVPAGSLNGRHRHCHCPLRQYAVDSSQFETFVRAFVDDDEITALGRANTYLDDASAGLVSRIATRPSSRSRSSTTTRRRRSSRRSRPSTMTARSVASVTGTETLDYDFNLLSQEDLENGELQFGLPVRSSSSSSSSGRSSPGSCP